MMTWSNKSIVSSTVSFGQRVPIKDQDNPINLHSCIMIHTHVHYVKQIRVSVNKEFFQWNYQLPMYSWQFVHKKLNLPKKQNSSIPQSSMFSQVHSLEEKFSL